VGSGWRSQQLESHLLERLGEAREPSLLETRYVLRWLAAIYWSCVAPTRSLRRRPSVRLSIRFQAELQLWAIPDVAGGTNARFAAIRPLVEDLRGAAHA
jgi:hypothetical protein